MATQAGINGFFPSVSACHFSFFEDAAREKRPPQLYFYDRHIREIDASLSLSILNPTAYNPENIPLYPLRARMFEKGKNASFGQRQASYAHNRNRFKCPNYPLRQARQARENDRLKDRLKPALYRINQLCHKAKLTQEEAQELQDLRVKLSPSYKDKVRAQDEKLRQEFNAILAQGANSQ